MTQQEVLDYLTKLSDKIDRFYADAIDNAKSDKAIDALEAISIKRLGTIEQAQWLVKEFGDSIETPMSTEPYAADDQAQEDWLTHNLERDAEQAERRAMLFDETPLGILLDDNPD
jgi:hypothetical protein